MPELQSIGRLLLVLGGALVFLGLLFLLLGKVPSVGRLPGDIYIEKGRFTFYFPIVTMLVVSLVLTLLLNLLLRLLR